MKVLVQMSDISNEEFILIIANALDISITEAEAEIINWRNEIMSNEGANEFTKFIFEALSRSDGKIVIRKLIEDNPEEFANFVRDLQDRQRNG
jgi:hypothetical protein